MDSPFMRHRLLHSTMLLALVAAPAILFAQEVSSHEEERLETLARSDDEWVTPKNSITVGFRMLTSGARVHFGHLGSVPFAGAPILPSTAGAALRTYQNGYVGLDAPRANELDSLGNQTSTKGGRYQTYTTTTLDVTDANGNVTTVTSSTQTGDYLSYTPGLTRQWSYDTPEQATLRPGYIGMSNYSATSGGSALDKNQGMSSGLEMQIAHVMGKLSKRTDWSLVAGIALNGINSKTAGDVSSTLLTSTDFYSLNGKPAPAISVGHPYAPPTNDPLNTTVQTETTTPLGAVQDPNLSTSTSTIGGIMVHGRWQVKGAYFMARVGPSIHTQLTERLGLSASLGLAGAFASSYYTADQLMEIPVVGKTVDTGTVVNYQSKFLGGYYADFNLDWSANERTGFYGGLSAQKLGNYDESVGDQTAHIDLGTSVGIRGGVNIKF
jgi:hypothetical protein